MKTHPDDQFLTREDKRAIRAALQLAAGEADTLARTSGSNAGALLEAAAEYRRLAEEFVEPVHILVHRTNGRR